MQLNMAAMLDMAFQLLAFFILTYSPGKVEGCIAIRRRAVHLGLGHRGGQPLHLLGLYAE